MRLEPIESIIIDDPERCDGFLQARNLSRAGILSVRDVAYMQIVDCSPLMAANAPGTLAYHFGVLEMRVQFLGEHWEYSSERGIEAIFNPKLNTKVVFQNVDIACSRVNEPKPRTEKGSGAERECQGNLFALYGVDTPTKLRPQAGVAVYFIMVDERGAVEFSRPVIENKKFAGFVERIFVSDGSDIEQEDLLPTGALEKPADDFDVPVRKRS